MSTKKKKVSDNFFQLFDILKFFLLVHNQKMPRTKGLISDKEDLFSMLDLVLLKTSTDLFL